MENILKGKQILVVEDEEINWFLIRDILNSYQAITTWAEVGQKAIDLVEGGAYFDAVLMDINLPSMDGLEVTRRILKLRPEMPVIAQTAFALKEEIELCYQAGCVGHVCKPFTIQELLSVVQNIFQEKDQ